LRRFSGCRFACNINALTSANKTCLQLSTCLQVKTSEMCAGVLTLQREQDIAYGVTLVWSLIAIHFKQWPISIIRIVSLSGLAVLTIFIVVAIVQRLRQRKYSPANSSDLEESLQS